MPYNHIMVDIETTGTQPETSNMIQLSAVRFDPYSRDVDPVTFDRCITPLGNRHWCQKTTRNFWSQHGTILQGIMARTEQASVVLPAFYTWCKRDMNGQEVFLWAKPTSFEWPFLQSYFEQFDLAIPFNYWNATDLRSFLRARNVPNLDREVEFVGEQHNAIHDVIHQIRVLFECLDKTGELCEYS